MEFLLGKELANDIKNKVREEVQTLSRKPKFVVLVNEEDDSSVGYVRSQEKNCLNVGILFESILMKSEEDYLSTLDRLNKDDTVDGIMITRPLPKGTNENLVLSHLDISKDVDRMNPLSLAELLTAQVDFLAPCTAEAIVRLMDYYNIEAKGKDILVIGRSISVGKPVALMLLNRHATVTIAHTRTINLEEKMARADIIIASVGRPQIIDASKAKEDCIIIDAGIHYLESGTVGDVLVSDKVKAISKVPGGVGPITSAVLLENILKLYHRHEAK